MAGVLLSYTPKGLPQNSPYMSQCNPLESLKQKTQKPSSTTLGVLA